MFLWFGKIVPSATSFTSKLPKSVKIEYPNKIAYFVITKLRCFFCLILSYLLSRQSVTICVFFMMYQCIAIKINKIVSFAYYCIESFWWVKFFICCHFLIPLCWRLFIAMKSFLVQIETIDGVKIIHRWVDWWTIWCGSECNMYLDNENSILTFVIR